MNCDGAPFAQSREMSVRNIFSLQVQHRSFNLDRQASRNDVAAWLKCFVLPNLSGISCSSASSRHAAKPNARYQENMPPRSNLLKSGFGMIFSYKFSTGWQKLAAMMFGKEGAHENSKFWIKRVVVFRNKSQINDHNYKKWKTSN